MTANESSANEDDEFDRTVADTVASLARLREVNWIAADRVLAGLQARAVDEHTLVFVADEMRMALTSQDSGVDAGIFLLLIEDGEWEAAEESVRKLEPAIRERFERLRTLYGYSVERMYTISRAGRDWDRVRARLSSLRFPGSVLQDNIIRLDILRRDASSFLLEVPPNSLLNLVRRLAQISLELPEEFMAEITDETANRTNAQLIRLTESFKARRSAGSGD